MPATKEIRTEVKSAYLPTAFPLKTVRSPSLSEDVLLTTLLNYNITGNITTN